MDDAVLAALSDTNCFETSRCLAVQEDENDGVLCVASGVPVAFLNVGFVTRPPADPDAALRRAMAFFDEREVPFVVRVREGVDARAEGAAERLGMPYSDTVPGMALHPVPAPPPPPGDLQIERVEDDDALDVFTEVMAAGFGMPIEIARRLITRRTIEAAGMECYVGRAGGSPVAVSTLCRTGRAAGVYNVTTLPDHRGHGYGEAMTWHPIARGLAQGCDVAVLQASKMGQPVYARMGFRVVAPYRTFHRVTG